jgi:hypothetical protein
MRGFIALLLAAGCLTAADPPRRDVFGFVGYGKTYDDEGSLGAGLNGGGGFGYRLTRRFGVQGDVNLFRTRREFGAGYPDYTAHGALVMGNGLLHFSSSAVQPYLLFGAGLLNYTNDVDFGGAPVNRSGTGFALDVGFGVKAFLRPNLSLRPEVRIYAGGAGSAVERPFSDLLFSIGVGYHW